MSFTLSVIRQAIKAQLEANISREVNIDTDGEGKPAPVVRFELVETPNYRGTFGPDGVAFVRARFVLDPAGVDQSAVCRLDDLLSVGTGNGSSVWDAIHADQSFGGTVQGLIVEPGEYDATSVTAELVVEFIALKQGANV